MSRNPKSMAAAVDAYIDGFNTKTLDKIVGIYAEGAVVEDPVGAPKLVGLPAIRAFYEGSLATGARLTKEGPVRVGDRFAAFAFSVRLNYGGQKQIDVIDIFEFDDTGKVVSMRAYWGPENMKDLA